MTIKTLLCTFLLSSCMLCASIIDVAKLPPHPRLILTQKTITEIIESKSHDPLRSSLVDRIVKDAREIIEAPSVQYRLRGPRLLDQSRRAIRIVLTCSAAYRLTNEAIFLERARKELMAVAAFPDWNPEHFLDVAEMSMAVAIGYDWLYSSLTLDEKKLLKDRLVKYALTYGKSAYGPAETRDQRLWFAAVKHNWNQVCNGGLIAAALAIAEDEPVLAETIVTEATKNIRQSMGAYSPDGGYPEGPHYWVYGTSYNVLAIAMLEGALKTDFDLSRVNGFSQTALYRLHTQSPSGLAFNYSDGKNNTYAACPFYTMLARRFQHVFALKNNRMLLERELKREGSLRDRFSVLHLVWFPSLNDTDQSPDDKAPSLAAHFRGGADIATFRSSWHDPNALFVGFKAGHNQENHAHMDLGSFVLDWGNVRWVEDLGSDDYNLPGYHDMSQEARRWTYFRLSNRSHSTLTINGKNQRVPAVAPIVAFATKDSDGFAVADLTEAYKDEVKNLKRGIFFADYKVIVQDEITGLSPMASVSWSMVTMAKVDLDQNGRGARLSIADKSLHMSVLSPDHGQLRIAPARPMFLRENLNDGATLVQLEITPASPECQIVVSFSIYENQGKTQVIRPLADWQL